LHIYPSRRGGHIFLESTRADSPGSWAAEGSLRRNAAASAAWPWNRLPRRGRPRRGHPRSLQRHRADLPVARPWRGRPQAASTRTAASSSTRTRPRRRPVPRFACREKLAPTVLRDATGRPGTTAPGTSSAAVGLAASVAVTAPPPQPPPAGTRPSTHTQRRAAAANGPSGLFHAPPPSLYTSSSYCS